MEMDMSTVAYRDFDLRRAPARAPRSTPACTHEGIVRRILAAIERSLARRAEQEAGRFIANHGGRLTDDGERQLAARFTGRGFLPYAPPRAFRPTANLLGR
jgi:pantothenate kinase type III